MNKPVTQPSPDSPRRVGHETTDASPFYVGLFALGLILMIAIVLLFLIWLMGRFETAAARNDFEQSPLIDDQLPPQPRLEVEPTGNLARLHAAEKRKLSDYGWIDVKRGAVYIPVDRAIEILAERGLPEPEDRLDPLPKQEDRIP